MGLETGTYIDSLVATNPVGATDPKSQGDDHIRLIKSTILATFPNIDGAMTATEDDLNILAGAIAANRVDIPVGDTLRVQDATGADTVDHSHDGTDAIIATAGTTNLDITGLGGALRVRDGAGLSVLDSTDADSITVSHDGTDVNAAFVGTTNFKFRDGVVVEVYDSADTDAVQISNDGTNGIINTNAASGALQIKQNGSLRLVVQDQTATGKTSSAQVLDRGNNQRDIGFNALPVFNDDADDTLEAQHSGSLQVKETTTGRTLTLEASGSTDFPVGHCTQLANVGSSVDYTITEGSGTTLYYVEPGVGLTDTTGGCTVGPGGVVTIYRRSAADYWIWGSEITA